MRAHDPSVAPSTQTGCSRRSSARLYVALFPSLRRQTFFSPTSTYKSSCAESPSSTTSPSVRIILHRTCAPRLTVLETEPPDPRQNASQVRTHDFLLRARLPRCQEACQGYQYCCSLYSQDPEQDSHSRSHLNQAQYVPLVEMQP